MIASVVPDIFSRTDTQTHRRTHTHTDVLITILRKKSGLFPRPELLCIQAILKAKHCVVSADTNGMFQSLNEIADNIKLLKAILTRMHGKISATRLRNLRCKTSMLVLLIVRPKCTLAASLVSESR